jgi:hypothetical protein
MAKTGTPLTRLALVLYRGRVGDEMGDSIDEKIRAYSLVARLQAYDISATFGDGQPGRIERRVVDKYGEYHLDTQAWMAGDVAYQCLKQLYPNGITSIEFSQLAKEFVSLACDVLYPDILRLAECEKIDIEPNGAEGLKEAWAEYGWCGRVMLTFDFFEGFIDLGADFDNPLNTVLPLALLQRLDDAVIAECCDGHGLSSVMLKIAELRDRLEPPKHVQRAVTNGREAQKKLDVFKQARRKGADAIHTENRAMKAEVFQWLNAQAKFKSIESAAMAITKQQPIAHVTARDWYKAWKKLRSASTP